MPAFSQKSNSLKEKNRRLFGVRAKPWIHKKEHCSTYKDPSIESIETREPF
jgi:hypothetical protein